MAVELAFALINPYSIAKSRTGGIIGRFMSRTGLELVGARMFGPSLELAQAYAERLRGDTAKDERTRNILADYVLRAYTPDPATGRPHRVLMLLFEGENAIEKIYRVAGPIRPNSESGETVRDTYGDYIVDEGGEVRYVEPAVLVAPNRQAAEMTLKLWAQHSGRDGGAIFDATDVAGSDGPVEKTLVLIKPDNFRFPSARPGNIIDLFSRSGLRIVGAKVHCMSVAEAEQFYGPVREVLRSKLKGVVAERAGQALAKELGIANGEIVQVHSKRGHIRAVAVVTKRLPVLTVAGKPLHQIGIPVHWGFMGETRKGFFCNNLTPYLGDANTQTPEFKAFLVKVEKVTGPAARHAELPNPPAPSRRWEGKTGATPKLSLLERLLKGRTEV